MKAIESYKMFDPLKLDKGLPPEKPGNYIFLLRPGVKLPEDVIKACYSKDRPHRMFIGEVTEILR